MDEQWETCAEFCPCEDGFEQLPVEDMLYLRWMALSDSVRRRSGESGAEKKLLQVLLRCGEMEKEELTAAAATKNADSSAALQRLAEQGLIEGTGLLRLTEKGEKAAQNAADRQKEERRALFSDLSVEEKQTMLSLLEKLMNGSLGQ